MQTGLLSKSRPLLSILMHFYLHYLYVFMFCLSNLPFTISLALSGTVKLPRNICPEYKLQCLKPSEFNTLVSLAPR